MIRVVRVPDGRSCPRRTPGNWQVATWGYLAVAVSAGELVGSAPGLTPSAALAGLGGEVADVVDSSREDRPAERRLSIHPGGEIEGPVRVRLEGTPFQLEVWEALMAIPHGSVVTYSDLAIGIGRPRAVRAVASACAANRLGVIVPCHRVVRADGSLGGYRWGEDLKRELLLAERQAGRDSTALRAA